MEEFDFSEGYAIIGRSKGDIKKYGKKGCGFIGKVVMSSGENPVLGRRIFLDLAKPHVVLICGKRGGGKSYTMSVLIEEFYKLDPEVKDRVSLIVIDTVGIFWTLKLPNKEQIDLLREWGLQPMGIDVNVYVPKGKLDFYKKIGIPIDGAFSLKTSELSVFDWLSLFNLSWKDPEGILLTRVIEKIREKLGTYYGIDEIVSAIEKDEEADKLTKEALKNRMMVAKTLGIFTKEGTKIKELARGGTINIIDVSAYQQATGVNIRDIIVALLGKKIFEERELYRKQEEITLIKEGKKSSEMPIVWLMIDEAHLFLPSDKETPASRVLLDWIRIGRQPGCSLLLATQRTAKLHPDALSQCDIFISHRMTAQMDIKAVSALRPSYMFQGFDKYYEQMPKAKGYALILDDNSEKIWMVKIRPRHTWDGGKTASAFRK